MTGGTRRDFAQTGRAILLRGISPPRIERTAPASATVSPLLKFRDAGIVATGGASVAPDGFGDIDPMEAARAAAASAAVMAYYGALIAEISSNPGLSPTQKGAAITALRQKMKSEAREASQAIMCAAQNAARARRMMLKGMRRKPRGKGL